MDQDCFFENASGFKRQSECKKDGVGEENHGKSCGIDLLCTNTSFMWKTGSLKAEFRQKEAKAFTQIAYSAVFILCETENQTIAECEILFGGRLDKVCRHC